MNEGNWRGNLETKKQPIRRSVCVEQRILLIILEMVVGVNSCTCLKVFLWSCFLQRLKNWELRERKKSRDYAKDTEREDERRREMVRVKKRVADT